MLFSLFSNVYSADVFGDYVYMIPGRTTFSGVNEAQLNIEVYAGRIGAGILEFSFGTTSRPFGAPHVLRISPSGDTIYVGDIADGKGTLWRFDVCIYLSLWIFSRLLTRTGQLRLQVPQVYYPLTSQTLASATIRAARVPLCCCIYQLESYSYYLCLL